MVVLIHCFMILGKGKFAVVYRARKLGDENIVALKRISVDMIDDKAREKCLKEVRYMASTQIISPLIFYACILYIKATSKFGPSKYHSLHGLFHLREQLNDRL